MNEQTGDVSTTKDLSAAKRKLSGEETACPDMSTSCSDQTQPNSATGDHESRPYRPECAHSETGSSDSKPEILGGRYELLQQLGLSCGPSKAFRVLDRRRLKFLGVDPFDTAIVLTEGIAADVARLNGLLAMTRSWQSLTHVPVVRVHRFLREPPLACLIAEHLQGESLAYRWADLNARPLSPSERSGILHATGAALSSAHAHGSIHGWLQPQAIWLEQSEGIRIFDPGVCQALFSGEASAEASGTTASRGLQHAAYASYASTEMLLGQAVDARTDVYSLACIAYELYTGLHPFDGLNAVDASKSQCEPRYILPLTRRQWSALRRALAFDRSRRTPSVLAFLDEFSTPKRSYLANAAAVFVAAFAVSAGIAWHGGQTVSGTAEGLAKTVVLNNKGNTQETAPVRTDTTAVAKQDDDKTVTAAVNRSSPAKPMTITATAEPASAKASAEPLVNTSPSSTVTSIIATDAGESPWNEQTDPGGLLREAEQQLAAGRYVEPKGSSAIDIYRSILERSPGNTAAIQGIERMVTDLRREARIAAHAEEYATAKNYLELARTVDPKAAGLIDDFRYLAAAQRSQTGSDRQAASGDGNSTGAFGTVLR